MKKFLNNLLTSANQKIKDFTEPKVTESISKHWTKVTVTTGPFGATKTHYDYSNAVEMRKNREAIANAEKQEQRDQAAALIDTLLWVVNESIQKKAEIAIKDAEIAEFNKNNPQIPVEPITVPIQIIKSK